MKLLLVSPRFVHRPGVFYFFPVGLAYVTASLKAAGFDVACLNTNHSSMPSVEQVKEKMKHFSPDVVLCGGLSVHFGAVKEILSAARQSSPDVRLIVGGGLVSSLPELALDELGADYGVIGEGELTSVALMEALRDGLPVSQVEGIVYRDDQGKLRLTRARPSIEPLDALPFPDYEAFEVATYLSWQLPNSTFATFPSDKPRCVPLVASRSCPFQCSFCYHPLGNHYRQRSLDNIFTEIVMLQERYNINGLSVYDELFAQPGNFKRVFDFCDFMKGRGISWQVSLRVDCVDDDLLARLKEAGCYYVCYGLESASEPVLKSMGKKITRAQMEQALKLTAKHRLGIQGNFIFGDSREDNVTAGETIAWWKAHLDYQLHLIMVDTYPGSRLYQRALQNGLIGDEAKYLEKGRFLLNNTSLSEADFLRLKESIHQLQQQLLFIEARVIEIQNGGRDSFDRQLYHVTVQCPHCGEIVAYHNICDHEFTNYSIHVNFHKLCCLSCWKRFDIPVMNHAICGENKPVGEMNGHA